MMWNTRSTPEIYLEEIEMTGIFYFSFRVMLLELHRYLDSIDPFVAIVCFCATFIVLWIIDYIVLHKVSFIILMLGALYLTALLSLLLLGRSPDTHNSKIDYFITYIQAFGGNVWAVYDIIFNVLLFIPFGMMLTRYNINIALSLILILSIPVLFELIQLLSSRGVFELSDIINNFLGGIIGYVFGVGISKARKTVNDKTE